LRDPNDPVARAFALFVLTLAGDHIGALGLGIGFALPVLGTAAAIGLVPYFTSEGRP
jgi:hypothetical protein